MVGKDRAGFTVAVIALTIRDAARAVDGAVFTATRHGDQAQVSDGWRIAQAWHSRGTATRIASSVAIAGVATGIVEVEQSARLGEVAKRRSEGHAKGFNRRRGVDQRKQEAGGERAFWRGSDGSVTLASLLERE